MMVSVTDSNEAPTESSASPVSGRRLTPKALATRARLVALATEVFANEGYTGASIRDIAERSGVTTGAIYSTFRGKAELLVEAVDAAITEALETLPDEVVARPLPDIDAYQFERMDDPARVRLRALLLQAAVAAHTDGEVVSRVRDTIESRISGWAEFHEPWQAGEAPEHLRDVDLQSLVTFLVALDLGRGVLEAIGVDVAEAADWAAMVRRLLGA
jgi:AcrR family transcriptional regulator